MASLISLVSVFVACGGAEAPSTEPNAEPASTAPTDSPGTSGASATAKKASKDACAPSAAPSNPPECPSAYTFQTCNQFACTRAMECWYPNSGDGQLGQRCPAAALIACVPNDILRDAGARDSAAYPDEGPQGPPWVSRCSQ